MDLILGKQWFLVEIAPFMELHAIQFEEIFFVSPSFWEKVDILKWYCQQAISSKNVQMSIWKQNAPCLCILWCEEGQLLYLWSNVLRRYVFLFMYILSDCTVGILRYVWNRSSLPSPRVKAVIVLLSSTLTKIQISPLLLQSHILSKMKTVNEFYLGSNATTM